MFLTLKVYILHITETNESTALEVVCFVSVQKISEKQTFSTSDSFKGSLLNTSIFFYCFISLFDTYKFCLSCCFDSHS